MAASAASGPVAASAVAAASACAGRTASAAAAWRLGLELGGACAAVCRRARPRSRLTRPARASRPAQTAVEWPPPPAPPWAHQDVPQAYAHAAFWPPPGGHAAATYEEDEDAGAYDEYEDDEPYEEPYDEGAFAAAGEVVWRVGDALDDDEEEDETPEVALELTDEWAARFALTEHRRAQRTPQPSFSFGFCASSSPLTTV